MKIYTVTEMQGVIFVHPVGYPWSHDIHRAMRRYPYPHLWQLHVYFFHSFCNIACLFWRLGTGCSPENHGRMPLELQMFIYEEGWNLQAVLHLSYHFLYWSTTPLLSENRKQSDFEKFELNGLLPIGEVYRLQIFILPGLIFQTMAFGAKWEQRRLKYSSSKTKDFGISLWITTWCLQYANFCCFGMVSLQHKNGRVPSKRYPL